MRRTQNKKGGNRRKKQTKKSKKRTYLFDDLEGKSKQEIYDFLTMKYGEWIVYKPKFNRYNFLLWFLPYLVLILGGVIIFILLKKRKNQGVN